ncbi:MAG: glycosyltransferase [Winogradskyella sp.]|uniref:glycosyltransferase n=1 Tax=Winogradskyella sp. TaxID=1883156 RepID=UPI0025D569F0|nr:glycosyltransferase [Winogradskyella sp.]NRB59403.1 glycosyltransferase [Winogradskyella sp.]
MKFLIITHVEHIQKEGKYYGYEPYIQEMNLWLKHVDEVEVVAPLKKGELTKIDACYVHSNLRFSKIPIIQFTSFTHALKSLFKIPVIKWKIFVACMRANHIHLRCPGNIGMFGAFIQICFPYKFKTAKYAGNWDPKSKQPLSYRIQKKILRNTFFTKRMQTLVYGNWPKQTKNIKSFFTASFNASEVEKSIQKDFTSTLRFVFVGSLVEGKQPLKAVQIVEQLNKKSIDSTLDLYGDGVLRQSLKDYIKENNLETRIHLKGNVSKDDIKKALRIAHFSILLSKSEGWPKAIAEAMFYGVIPVASKVSCVPWMLNYGERGVLVDDNEDMCVSQIINTIEEKNLNRISKAAKDWSQQYNLDYFEEEIQKLLAH